MHKIYLCQAFMHLCMGSAECLGIQILTIRYFNTLGVFWDSRRGQLERIFKSQEHKNCTGIEMLISSGCYANNRVAVFLDTLYMFEKLIIL